MLRIETSVTWREMGRQIGEEFRELLPQVIDHFARWLVEEAERYAPAIDRLRGVVAEHCPEILDETLGMAQSAGIDPDLMLGYRYFNEVRNYEGEGCSGVFVADGAEGPLLGRTCDIERDISAEIQICRVCRPTGGIRTLLVTYLGLTGGVGFNEHGIGLTGSSAGAVPLEAAQGLPTGVMNHLITSRCRTLEEVRELLGRHTMRCKGAIELVCDADGNSMLVELATGHPPLTVPRAPGRTWQVCSNFFASDRVPIRRNPYYLESAYARYGRMVHLLDSGRAGRSVAGVKALIEDIAQPGLVAPEDHCLLFTAYAFVADLRARTLHVCPGNPAQARYFEVTL
jgi:hypothetical protein